MKYATKSILMLFFLFWSCRSEDDMKQYYEENKTELNEIKTVGGTLLHKYNFEYCSLRQLTSGIRFSVYDKKPFKSTIEYFDPETLSPILYSKEVVCDGCTVEERRRYVLLLNDQILKKLIKLYIQIEPNAMKITSDGIFLALGSPLKHLNKSEVEGGIYMPFDDNFISGDNMRKINNDIYLTDMHVE